MLKNFHQTRQGVASLYVVLSATILFGIITLSFTRIILSERNQSINDELSQSAYDSAMAGVEDAKVAVNKYYKCLSGNSSCTTKQQDGTQLFGGNCDDFKLRNYLYDENYGTGEVPIQVSSETGDAGHIDQAYTCVIVNNIVPDYRSTLTSDNRTRVVPLGLSHDEDRNKNVELEKVKNIAFSWYSATNGTVFQNLNHGGQFANRQNATIPPTISLTLIRSKSSMSKSDFNDPNNTTTSTMILLPVEGGGIQAISQSEINTNANAYRGESNEPFQIQCTHDQDFACTVTLTDMEFSAGENAALIVSLPYGDTITDFAVTLYESDGTTVVNFENTQISVDSTGRANQLVRRVESRLDPADLFFPYPQYGIELTGDGDDSFWKNFWITNNCWTESGTCANNGDL